MSYPKNIFERLKTFLAKTVENVYRQKVTEKCALITDMLVL